MRDSLFRVVQELQEFSDPDRVREAAMLQDELREAQQMVTAIREAAADATIELHGPYEGSRLSGTPAHTLRVLAEGFRQ